jgi:pimeloyl-ACP methyl ester carboxylesterase
MLDPVFDAFYASNVQFNPNATYQQQTVQAAGAKLLEKIGEEVWVVGHSQGGLMAVLLADARANLTKGIILLEPTGPPFQETIFSNKPVRNWGLTDIPLTYPPPVKDPLSHLIRQEVPALDNTTISCIIQAEDPAPRKLVNLAPKSIITVTSEASYHALYDYCTVQYLKQAGCAKTTHLDLGKIGTHGNSHMMFMEKNSDKIWKAVHGWIEKNE